MCFAAIQREGGDGSGQSASGLGAAWTEAAGFNKSCWFSPEAQSTLRQVIASSVAEEHDTLIKQKLDSLIKVQAQPVAFVPLVASTWTLKEEFAKAFQLSQEHFEVDGVAKPWLVSIQDKAWCWGFTSWPMACVSSFIYVVDQPVLLVVLPLSTMLASGLQNLEAVSDWLAKDGAAENLREGAQFYLPKGSMVYIPFGHVALVTGVGAEAESDEDAGANAVLVYPILDTTRAEAAPVEVRVEVAQMFQRNLAKMGKSRPWSVVKTALLKWVDTWMPKPTDVGVVPPTAAHGEEPLS